MPFTAVCPHCRAAKFRAPRKKIGSAFVCVRCRGEFTLEPATRKELRELKEARAANTVPTAAAGTEPSMPAAPMPSIPAAAAEQTDYPLRFALLALVLFGTAGVAVQFPYGRIVAVPLAGFGAALAALTLFGLERHRRVAWAGIVLNALALVAVLGFPDWFALGPWVPAPGPDNGPKPVTAVGRDGGLPRGATWVDAADAVWEQGDVRVAVLGLVLSPADKKSKDRFLQVRLKVTNVGVARAVEFAGWPPVLPPEVGPALTTETGKVLVQRPDAEKLTKVTVYPGKSVETTLTFAANAGPPADLRLELPAGAFGGDEPVKFSVPRSLVPVR